MPAIVTLVHGTWARNAGWTREGSQFRKLLEESSNAEIVFRRFDWSGRSSLVAILLTIFASIGILHLESSPNALIKDADDALWWSIVTLTTVGYGDLYPVSPNGRLLATALMIVGVGLFSAFAAYLASSMLSPADVEQEAELTSIRQELAAIRRAMDSGGDASFRLDEHAAAFDSRTAQENADE